MKKILLSIVLFSMFSFISCNKIDEYDLTKISKTSWNPNIAIPLAKAEFGVYDILAQTDSTDLVVIDGTSGEIALVYRGEVFSFVAEDIIELPNVQTQLNIDMADFSLVAVPSFNNTANFQYQDIFNFPTSNGVEFHTITFKGGQLNLQLSTDIKHDLTIEISFPALIKNGIPLVETIQLVYANSIPQTAIASIDLTGVVGDFTNNGTTVNQLIGDYDITITGTGEEITANENIQTEIQFFNLKYRNATGYFGQQSLGADQDSILLKIFTSSTTGYFELTNPKIKLEMFNSFGFPIDVSLTNLKTVDANTGISYPLTGYANPISIPAPANFGEFETASIEFNNSNTTNLSTIITPVPKYFYFEAEGTSNPTGPTSVLNFIEDTSQFKVNAELELPLEGFAYGFALTDTFEFDFNENIEEIHSVLFRFYTVNGFPVDLSANMVFVDSLYQPLLNITNGDELFLDAAETNVSGTVISSTEKVTDLTVFQSNFNALSNSKHIIVTAKAQTLNGPNHEVVKFFDFYKLSIKIGMQVQGNIKL